MRSLLSIVFILTLLSCVRKEEEIIFISEDGHFCVHNYPDGDYTKEYCSHVIDKKTIEHQDSIIKNQRVIINEMFKYVEERESTNTTYK